MANTILLRQGTTTPSGSAFSVGEPAWDKSAGKLYIKNQAGYMVNIGPYTGGAQTVIAESQYLITSDYTLSTNTHGSSIGPVEIASGVTVTIPQNSIWLVLN